MKAISFQSKGETLTIKEIARPEPKSNEVLVGLKYAGINHRDLWIYKEQVLPASVILGSDGSGVVHSAGENVSRDLIGKEVIINPSLNWGGNENVQGKEFEILGNPTNGTFAEFITIPVDYIYPKPSHLSLKEAAAIPLAGLTAYRALFTKAKITSTDKVLITGTGGGAALFLLQFALAAGCTVYVTSSSSQKIENAVSLGAKGGFNYTAKDWVTEARQEAGGFDVIIDSAGGDGFALLTEVANAGARIVLFGRTAGNINHLSPGIIFNKQLVIMGSLMGTQKEFKAMIEFVEEHKIHPVLDKEFSLQDLGSAFDHMERGKHFGKITIAI